MFSKGFLTIQGVLSKYWGQIPANIDKSDWAWCQQHLRLVRHKIYCTSAAIGKCKIMTLRPAGIFIQYEKWNWSVVFHNRLRIMDWWIFQNFTRYFFNRYRYLEDATFYRGSGNDNEQILCLKKKSVISIVHVYLFTGDGTTEVLICWPGTQKSQLS